MAEDSEPYMAGTNVEVEITDDQLTMRVDLTQRHGPSSTGVTTIVGTTHGSKRIAGEPDLRYSVNVYDKAKQSD